MLLDVLILTITLLLMFVGLVGIILPSIPGIILIWTAVFFHTVLTRMAYVDMEFIIFITALTFLAIVLDYAENLWGSRRARTPTRILLGAVLGGFIASFTESLGITALATFGGALVGQMLSGRDPLFTVHAGGYKIILFAGGTLVQVGVGVTVIELFLLRVLPALAGR
ncbi:MAG: DUF456 domain-containing protein [Candidatus Kerfeldbacteria bacterium]|nr:DUF456 domain-containing protein [Candidatus Kerfeldbacteria bacterium]